MEQFYDRGNGLGLDVGHRGFLNEALWSSRGYGMERYDPLRRGPSLGLGLRSPRLGDGLGLGAGHDGLWDGIYGRERFGQPL
jgi:hypothetical protein